MGNQTGQNWSWSERIAWGMVVALIVGSFLDAIWTAFNTGMVTVGAVGRFSSTHYQVPWRAGWARFAGPILFFGGLQLTISTRVSPKWSLWGLVALIFGIVLLLFSAYFTSLGSIAAFFGIIAYAIAGLYVGNRYGFMAALVFTGSLFAVLIWISSLIKGA